MKKELISNCLAETHKHVRAVSGFLTIFVKEILERGLRHDDSKFEEPELSIFAEHQPELGKTAYGSAEYSALLEKVKPAITHHYARNRHHPEFHRNGIEDMDLVDLIEMLSDWTAATQRNKDGNIRKSIEHNTGRYNMTPQLARILTNTVDRYF